MIVRQCGDGAFPAELWLGISRDAVSVYKRGEAWPLEVFPYEQILSFGAPLPNAYKIMVEGRELLFETQMVGSSRQKDFRRKRAQIKAALFWSRPQVMDVAKLMKAYISMIVKKRYSNCQSVSSHGSAW